MNEEDDVQPPDQELMQVMVAISNQLGEFIKRKQAEAALRQEQEKSEQLDVASYSSD
ncbi:hypothetical protein [Coleofasciculus sp. F4-SAH-05]|uniref:hypothetical protein n=1 Tax=Coleofasciculus sp. F4-SAH-05 TaxID=3069525 RepID=UPI0032FD06FD